MNVSDLDVPQSAGEIPANLPAQAEPAPGGVRGAFGNFFHGTELPYRVALTRICLAFAILFPTAYRWYYSREIFSTYGSGISEGGERRYRRHSNARTRTSLEATLSARGTSFVGYRIRLKNLSLRLNEANK